MKDHHFAGRDRDSFAGAWISSKARGLTSHNELAKVGDRDWFPFLQGALEKFKISIQQRNRHFFECCAPLKF